MIGSRFHAGPVGVPESSAAACPMVWAPVRTPNGATYDNACLARGAGWDRSAPLSPDESRRLDEARRAPKPPLGPVGLPVEAVARMQAWAEMGRGVWPVMAAQTLVSNGWTFDQATGFASAEAAAWERDFGPGPWRGDLLLDGASIGWVPVPGSCNDTVGQIQQALNFAHEKKRLGDKGSLIDPIMPLTVDGRPGQATQQALAVAVPGWDMQISPATTLRQLRQKFSPPTDAPFMCDRPGAAPEAPGFFASLPSWAPAAGVAAAILFAALAARGRTA
jgi:hypothetical protein